MRAQGDLFAKYLELWQTTARRASGETSEPVVSPAKGDKRFNDPDWSDNPVFDVIKQSYLLTANFLNDMVSDVDGVDPLEKRRVEFFMRMLTDAFAPSNFLASNPTALKEVMTSGGQSLVKGMENFQDDLQRGGGADGEEVVHLAGLGDDVRGHHAGSRVAGQNPKWRSWSRVSSSISLSSVT